MAHTIVIAHGFTKHRQVLCVFKLFEDRITNEIRNGLPLKRSVTAHELEANASRQFEHG